ncbi:MAG TPA: TIGR02117 family protein [Bacteroidia bacterium]|jgi:uncharacterized protein (TIGR02117 family)|nr:TIGR02117 family protein [Bacteroidia bacterium]
MKTLRILLIVPELFMVFLIGYLLCSFWLPRYITGSPVKEQKQVELFIESNGVHTDFVMPARSGEINWFDCFPSTDFVHVDSSYSYVKAGWGDKGFFLDTKTWADLKVSVAFKAVFGLSSAAMHIAYSRYKPEEGRYCKRIMISHRQYKELIKYIQYSFSMKNGAFQHIKHEGYTDEDTFYEGLGTYSLFKTCNVWTGTGLKQIGCRIGIWTPFEDGIMDHL